MNSNIFKSNKWIAVLFVAALMGSIISCQEKVDTDIPNTHEESTTTMLVFTDEAEFQETLSKVTKMKDTEKEEWEKSNNFNSFGSICDDLYESISFEKISSSDEFNEFVENNSNFIQFVKDEDGEQLLETSLYSDPQRYIINSDRMYQVGTRVYKVFEDFTISSQSSNVELLKTLTKEEVLSNANVEIENKPEQPSMIRLGFSTSDRWESDNGYCSRDRTYMFCEVFLDDKQIAPDNTVTAARISLGWEVKPYKRFMGAWVWCTRTCYIKYNVKIQMDSQPWTTFTFNDTKSDYARDFIDGVSTDLLTMPNNAFGFSITSVNIEGWTPSTSCDIAKLTSLNNKP